MYDKSDLALMIRSEIGNRLDAGKVNSLDYAALVNEFTMAATEVCHDLLAASESQLARRLTEAGVPAWRQSAPEAPLRPIPTAERIAIFCLRVGEVAAQTVTAISQVGSTGGPATEPMYTVAHDLTEDRVRGAFSGEDLEEALRQLDFDQRFAEVVKDLSAAQQASNDEMYKRLRRDNATRQLRVAREPRTPWWTGPRRRRLRTFVKRTLWTFVLLNVIFWTIGALATNELLAHPTACPAVTACHPRLAEIGYELVGDVDRALTHAGKSPTGMQTFLAKRLAGDRSVTYDKRGYPRTASSADTPKAKKTSKATNK